MVEDLTDRILRYASATIKWGTIGITSAIPFSEFPMAYIVGKFDAEANATHNDYLYGIGFFKSIAYSLGLAALVGDSQETICSAACCMAALIGVLDFIGVHFIYEHGQNKVMGENKKEIPRQLIGGKVRDYTIGDENGK